MNPRQRRGVILVAVAAVGAVGVFLSVARYVAQVGEQVGPLATVVVLRTDARAYEEVTVDMVEEVQMPRRWAPSGAVRAALAVAGLVPASDLPAGTLLQSGMLLPAPDLQPGQRELAILVDAETGVAGKIARGSVVDIVATFPASETEAANSVIVVQNARILDVAAEREREGQPGLEPGRVVPVTFALDVDESLRLAYIESFADRVRLALRHPGDSRQVPSEASRYELVTASGADDPRGAAPPGTRP